MPGSKPPSIAPSRQRTATKPAKLRTNPKHIVTTPHKAVIRGNQTLGDAFLRIRLLGSSLVVVSQPN